MCEPELSHRSIIFYWSEDNAWHNPMETKVISIDSWPVRIEDFGYV